MRLAAPSCHSFAIPVCAAAMAACLAHPASANEAPLRIEVITAGRYVALDTGTTLHEAGRGATADVGGIDRTRFVETGEQLTLHYCTKVGIRFRAPGVRAYAPVPVTVEVLHPPVPFPDGPHDRDAWQTTVDERPRTLGVTFEEEGMMQAGTWTINIVHGGRVVATQRFELSLSPDLGPEPEDCSPPTS